MNNVFSQRASPERDRQPESQELVTIRKGILQIVLIIASLVGTFAYFSNIFSQIQEQSWVIAAVQTMVYAIVLIITATPRLPYRLRLNTLLAVLLLLSLSDLVEGGLTGEGRLFLMTFAVIATLLLSHRSGIWLFVLSVILLAAVGALMVTGVIPVPVEASIDNSGSTGDWLTGGMIYAMLTLLLMSAIIMLVRRLENYMVAQKQLTKDLERERASLEVRVKERTSLLEKQAAMMEISARYMQEVSRLTDQPALIDYTVHFLIQQFGIHNIFIGITDPSGEFCIPASANGRQAQAFQEQAQRIRLRQPGTVGDLIAKGKPRLVMNSGDESVYFRSSGLDELHSLVVLPLLVNTKLMGTMLLFNSVDRGTGPEEVQLYQTIAGQFAAALEKARLLEEVSLNLEALKAHSNKQTRHTWRTYLQNSRQSHSFHYDRQEVQPGAAPGETAAKAMRQGKVMVTTITSEDGRTVATNLAVPIILREQPIGVMDIRFEGENLPADMVGLVDSAMRRLAIALDNVRLMEQAQARAEREHAVSGIGSQIRSQGDIDSILKTAAVEIGRSLGVSEVLVQLRADQAA